MFQNEREHLQILDKKQILNFLKEKPHFFLFFPEKWKRDREIVIEAIYRSPYNFKHIPEKFKNDKNIVLQTIALNGYLFYIIPQSYRDDKEVCLLAINSYSFNTRYISEKLQFDEDIFFLLVMKNSWSINYMSSKLRNDEKIIEKALELNRNILSYLNSNLKYDINFTIDILIKKFNFLLPDFPILIRHNTDIMKCAVEKNYINFVYVPRNDKNFLFELYLINPEIKCFLENTMYQYVLDKYNYLILLYYKNKEDENIFHTRDIAYYIMDFLF